MPTAAQFSQSLRQFSKDTQADSLTMLNNLSTEALRRIVNRTPVRSGRAKANWRVSIGRQPANTREVPAGTPAFREGRDRLRRNRKLTDVFISNPVPYINALEQGSSKQAPAGMVRRTVRELQR